MMWTDPDNQYVFPKALPAVPPEANHLKESEGTTKCLESGLEKK